VIYAVSTYLRDEILAKGVATLRLDLAPDRDVPRLAHDLSRLRGKRTMATHLQRQAHIEGVKAGLLREVVSKEDFADPARLAAAIKALPLRLVAPRPLEEAISTAGGVPFEALDERLMIRTLPGIFCAGEMLDWEAPTGGYLLTTCFATGRAAGAGAVAWLKESGRGEG
jgi:predicted flavoprotein YhiN